jgi:large subunit ribosomal protein L21
MMSHHSYLSTEARTKYAVVDHSGAYERAMKGRHGDQLSLAQIEGLGKDDPPFDPFIEEELAAASAAEEDESEDGEADEEEKGEYDVETEADEAEVDLVRYNNDGSVRWKKSDLAAFRAGAPAGGFFAIIELAGTQHKITVDDVIVSAKLNPVTTYSVGSVHTLKDVLLVGSSHLTLVGLPLVGGAEVNVMVEEITKDAKVIVFKKRRRKNSQRKKGFRRDVTMLRVLDIRMPSEHKDHSHVLRKEGTMDE